jgi:hypothetical protein
MFLNMGEYGYPTLASPLAAFQNDAIFTTVERSVATKAAIKDMGGSNISSDIKNRRDKKTTIKNIDSRFFIRLITG